MARIGAPPETHYTLPPDFAAALGQCVANFGWLEEIIKRTIYALDRARLADDLTQEELQTWLTHIGQISDDSMGTLIDQLDAAMRRYPGLRDRNRITDRLSAIRLHRKMAGRIIRVGLPTGIQNMVISFSNVLVQASVNSYGAAAMAGFAAYMKIDGFNILPVSSISMAA